MININKIEPRLTQLVWLNQLFKALLIILLGTSMASCGEDIRIWREEVKLLDGRVIVVTQKKRCEGAYTGGNYASCIAREAWLTINLPEFSKEPIIWHENLYPIVVNVYEGRLYLVGAFPTQREFKLYGQPTHPYIAFVWKNQNWQPIPFKSILEAIYDINMLLEATPSKEVRLLTLVEKEGPENNGDRRISEESRRISATKIW